MTAFFFLSVPSFEINLNPHLLQSFIAIFVWLTYLLTSIYTNILCLLAADMNRDWLMLEVTL